MSNNQIVIPIHKLPKGCKECPVSEYHYGDTYCRILQVYNEMAGGRLNGCPIKIIAIKEE